MFRAGYITESKKSNKKHKKYSEKSMGYKNLVLVKS